MFYERLRFLMQSKSVTVAHLVEVTDLSRQAIHMLLAGSREPKWETVQQLADALGVSTEEFRK